ncbi:MAG: hypothetical protein JXB15_15125, partial [Anaerolineales bacterium]|nr:hypothetical protein [Anaerolineales bacterium]
RMNSGADTENALKRVMAAHLGGLGIPAPGLNPSGGIAGRGLAWTGRLAEAVNEEEQRINELGWRAFVYSF